MIEIVQSTVDTMERKNMNNGMQMRIDKRKGNMHIKLDGSFTPDGAAKLTMLLSKSYEGKGNIFIHTDKITHIAPDSRYAFCDLLDLSGLPGEKIYLMGKKGLEFCHDRGKVIVARKKQHGHSGCGRCKNCSCEKKKAA